MCAQGVKRATALFLLVLGTGSIFHKACGFQAPRKNRNWQHYNGQPSTTSTGIRGYWNAPISTTTTTTTTTTVALHAKRSEQKTAEIEIQRKKAIQERFKMTRKETDTVEKRWPQILKYQKETIIQKMDWIQEYLDINDKTLKKIFTKCPSIVGQNLTTLEGKMKYYQETLGWSIKDVATVMTTSRIITLSTEFNIEPKRQWLSNTFNATKNDISKLIKKNPGLLSANVDDMVDRLEFLQDQLELHSSEAKQKLVWKVPCALALTKDTLNSKVTWFQSSSLGLTKREMAKAIRSRPTLLTSSIEMNLEPSLKWLNDRFGQAAARKMIMSNPPILGYSISEKIEPRLDYLEGTFGLNDTELSIMVCKLPSILGLNQASLEEKLQFYATCVGSRPETLEFISRNPRLLSASLDKRLIPRWEQVLEFKLPERGFRVPMLTMACYPSAQWEKYLARRKMLILESQQTLK